MEKRVKKELEDAKSDIKDAIDAERRREASVESLRDQTLEIDKSMGDFRTESEKAKSRIWWKSLKWIALAGALVFLVVGLVMVFVIAKFRQAFSNDHSS